MHGISKTAALALLSLASAAPTVPSVNNILSGSFIVSNVPTGNNVTRDGPSAYKQALSKYGFTTDSSTDSSSVETADGGAVSNAISSASSSVAAANRVSTGSIPPSTLGSGSTTPGSETGEVAANSQRNDVEYTSSIQVGGQTIEVNFDTGSSDLWLFNTLMDSRMTSGHTLYDPSKSSTWQQTPGSSFSVSYGDASKASGSVVGTDSVNIGGAVYANQVIELPDQVTNSFIRDNSSNGLVGLAFGKLNTVKPNAAKTFIENIAGQLKEPLFTANLKHISTGSYEFGNIDSSSYTGPMAWAPVDNSRGFWQFTSDFYAIKNRMAVKTNAKASPAIADTGTSLMLMDPVVVSDYYAQLPGSAVDGKSGGYVFPCSTAPPDFFIGISGSLNQSQTIQIPGSLINYAPINSTHCFGGLQSNNGAGVQVLGDILFKAAFVVFHYGKLMLGFASHTAN